VLDRYAIDGVTWGVESVYLAAGVGLFGAIDSGTFVS
jgi:hypothetical protein